MKSLSVNAQEFIPLNNKNNNNSNSNLMMQQGPNGGNTSMIYIVNDANPKSYIHNAGMVSPLAAYTTPLTISTKSINDPSNQYSFYLNQSAAISPNVMTGPQPMQPLLPGQQALTVTTSQPTAVLYNGNQAHIIHSPIAGFHSPIQPLLPPQPSHNPNQYPFNAQNMNFTSYSAPAPSVYQLHPNPYQPNFIDNTAEMMYQQPLIAYNPMSSQQNNNNNNFNQLNYISNNTLDKKNRPSFNKNNRGQSLQNKQNKNNMQKINKNKLLKHQNLDITNNEKEWPSLISQNINQTKPKNKNEEDDEDDTDTNSNNNKESISIDEKEVKEPYLRDEMKLKMLIKNVNFIKTAVEQHYLNENSITQKKLNVSNPDKLSFKEIILNQRPKGLEKEIEQKIETIKEKNLAIQEEKTKDMTKATRQNKSKKKNNKNDETPVTENEKSVINFHLKNEEFPDLSSVSNTTNIIDLKKLENFKNDTFTSEANSKLSQINKPSDQSKQSSKKSSQPIMLEFANMITALQKGQNFNLVENQIALNNKNKFQSSRNQNLVNPLDPTSTVKRGKEREKPKNKKPSTLKKIIIKEREEKKKLKEQSIKIDSLALNLAVDTIINTPLSNDLILNSPIENEPTQFNNADFISKCLVESDSKPQKENSKPRETYRSESDESKEMTKDYEDQSSNDSDDSAKNQSDNNENEENQVKNYENKDNNAINDENCSENKEKSNHENSDLETSDDEEEDNIDGMSNPLSPISQGTPISLNGYSPSPYTAYNVISNERNLVQLEKLEEQVRQKIHSRKFREYCNQIINRDIDDVCMSLLQEIVRFQDRLYHKNPVKAKVKRRYVMGIREVTKHLKLQKLKCVILAPNCEKIQSKGGLDDAINLIIQTSMKQNVPFVFALGRKGLGKAVNKVVPISVVGIFDYSGAEQYFKRLVELANNAKLTYQEMVEEYEKEECENLILMQSNVVNNLNPVSDSSDLLKSSGGVLSNGVLLNSLIPSGSNNIAANIPKIPSHMAHSRTPSTGSNISIEPYFMNYHTHSRSASGNFNYGHTTTIAPGHTRSASGGGGGTLNIDLSLHNPTKNWASHSRTPSNCSNISFISRLSEPISEIGAGYIGGSSSSINHLNTSSTLAAVQFYNEQVRQEMSAAGATSGNDSLSNSQKSQLSDTTTHQNSDADLDIKDNVSQSLANLHLGSINENDAGNEADNEADCCDDRLDKRVKNKTLKKQSSSTESTEECDDEDEDEKKET